jgi:O2-independent ubiquinone biosynthesis accessory factor UbiT
MRSPGDQPGMNQGIEMNIPATIKTLLQNLPEAPPAFALATALNLARPKLWPEEDFAWMAGKTVRFTVTDLEVGVSITHDGERFAHSSAAPDVTFGASVDDYLILARRQEDPDTLFFQRRLLIEGDTEVGLALKNLMDATDLAPLLAFLPQSLLEKLGLPQ